MSQLITALGFTNGGDRILAATNSNHIATGSVSAILDGLDKADNTSDDDKKATLTMHECAAGYGRVFAIDAMPGNDDKALLCHRRKLAVVQFGDSTCDTYKVMQSAALPGNASSCRCVSKGLAAVGFEDGWLRLVDVDVDGGRVVEEKRIHSDCINDIAFNAATGALAACSEDATVSLWTVDADKRTLTHTARTHTLPSPSPSPSSSDGVQKRKRSKASVNTWLSAVDLSSNGAWMVCGGTGGAYVFSTRKVSGNPIATLQSKEEVDAKAIVTRVCYLNNKVYVSYDNGVVCVFDGDVRTARVPICSASMIFALSSNVVAAPAHLRVLAAGGDGGRVHLLFAPAFASVACSVNMTQPAALA